MTPFLLVAPLVAVVVGAALLLVLWVDRYSREPLLPFAAAVLAGVAAVAAAGKAGDAGAGLLTMQTPAGASAEASGLAEILVVATWVALPLALLCAGAALVLSPPSRFPGFIEPLIIATAPALGAGAWAGAAAVAVGALRPADAATHLLWWAVSGAVVGLATGWARVALRPPLRAFLLCLAPVAGGAVTVGSTMAMGAGPVVVFLANVSVAAVAGLVPAALLVGAVGLSYALEGRVIKTELGQEVAMAVLPEWVVFAVSSFRRRAFGSWWQPRDERRVVSQLLTRLAFRLRALRRAGGDAVRVRGLEVGRLRQKARELLQLRGDGDAPHDHED